jgi:hypothetical protein
VTRTSSSEATGAIGGVPVYNVAVHVTRGDFFVFELDSDAARGERLAAPAS